MHVLVGALHEGRAVGGDVQHRAAPPVVLDGRRRKLPPDGEREAGDDLRPDADRPPGGPADRRVDDRVKQRGHHDDGERVRQPKKIAVVLEARGGEVVAVAPRVHLARLRQKHARNGALQNVEEQVAREQDRHSVQAHAHPAGWQVGAVHVAEYEAEYAHRSYDNREDLQEHTFFECVHEGHHDHDRDEDPTEHCKFAHSGIAARPQRLHHQADDRVLLLPLHLPVAKPPHDEHAARDGHEGGGDGPGEEIAIFQGDAELRRPRGRPAGKECVGDRAAHIDGQVEIHEKRCPLFLRLRILRVELVGPHGAHVRLDAASAEGNKREHPHHVQRNALHVRQGRESCEVGSARVNERQQGGSFEDAQPRRR
mmetsp:Transcript_91429/g.279819  ORF Transcript_91429/g.279819 Transcript_91429/m.279819 type:complete len:368 (+) Transcript_91429:466-1569(+)